MLDTFNLLQMAIKHDILYHKLINEPGQVEIREEKWAKNLDTLQTYMVNIDKQIVNNAANQIETDFYSEIVNERDKDEQRMANNLYDWFSAKYYWKEWMVLVVEKVSGWSNHAYKYCRGHTVFELRYSKAYDKTILMVHVDKASGTYLTEDEAIRSLRSNRPYEYWGTCER